MKDKLENFLDKLEEEGVENFVVAKPSNLFYLLEEYNLSGFLLIRGGEPILITSKFFRYSVEDLDIKTLIYSDSSQKKDIFKDLEISGNIFSDAPSTLEEILGGVEKSDRLEKIRRIKNEDEVERIRKAASVSVGAMKVLRKNLQEKKTEWELAAVADGKIRNSACYNAFETLVHSGSTEPHRHLRDKPVDGDLIIVDLGAKYEGYCSDMTRTYCLDPDDEQKKLYEDVLEIYRKILGKIEPGVKFGDLAKYADKLVKEKSYDPDENFLHKIGHSLGVEIHEDPGFRLDEETEIKEGMVFTLEPGLYLPEVGGVRIEDTIYVKEENAEILTKFPKDLNPK